VGSGSSPHLWSFPPTAAYTSFPTPDCWVCAAAPAGWRVYPPSPMEFSSLRHSHKLYSSWWLGACPCSSPLWPGLACLFTVPGEIPLPLFGAQGSPLSLQRVFIVLLLITQFLFFPWWGSVCPGGGGLAQGCLWKYCEPLSSPCPRLPKRSGRGRLAVAWEPSWFRRLTWSGDSLRRLEVWRGQSFASSRWPCLRYVSPASLQDFTIGGRLSVSSF
jgi:hypothetical protein